MCIGVGGTYDEHSLEQMASTPFKDYIYGLKSYDPSEIAAELVAIADQPFARGADDGELEALRKGAVRDGDPMADYIRSQRGAAEEAARPADARPLYKGPPPPPNRFGIRPGYRWDGIDRGNGWEAKLQRKHAEAVGAKNDRYAWSCADM